MVKDEDEIRSRLEMLRLSWQELLALESIYGDNALNLESMGGLRTLQPGPKLEGAELLWNKFSHPKHSFCSWLAFLNRLSTKDNLRGSFNGNKYCCWCESEKESGHHLFFICAVGKPIHFFLEIININVCWNSWEDIIEWFKRRSWRGKDEKTILAFIINAAIYETWRARNKRIFLEDNTSVEQLILNIWKVIKARSY
ncbi:hypothetical protein QQ045_012015 [Rhodiola kirilowii]